MLRGKTKWALLVTLTVAAASLFYTVPRAQESATVTPQAPTAAPPERTLPPVERKDLSPMHQEIFDATLAERAEVETLNQKFLRALTLEDKIAAQKDIEARKKAGQVTVLEIQLRYARAAVNEAAVLELEAAIANVRSPRPFTGSGPTLLEGGVPPGK